MPLLPTLLNAAWPQPDLCAAEHSGGAVCRQRANAGNLPNMTHRLTRVARVGCVVAAIAAGASCGGSSSKRDGSANDSGAPADTGSPDTGWPIDGSDTAPPIQYFILSWTIEDYTTGQPLSCTQAAAVTVQAIVDATMTFNLPCASGQGMTGVLAPGRHSVGAALLDAQQVSLSQAAATTFDLSPNTPRTLPSIVFDVL
jgi:hypothetical protein